MAEKIHFTRNFSDQSTPEGFQFEFYCDRCGSGFRTPFKANPLGTVSNVLETASGLLGGLLGRAADVSNQVRDAAWERAHDNAFVVAAEDLKADFKQCPRCSSWVCENCWNDKRGLCKQCAPDLGVEMSAAQASRSVEEVWAHAKMSAEDKHLAEGDWRETIVASCPSCGHALETNASFCPECGQILKDTPHCKKCDALLQPDAKFCDKCGERTTVSSTCACGKELAPDAKFCPDCGAKR
jgi:membrane protease subunit (stomatin/prohibitin family)